MYSAHRHERDDPPRTDIATDMPHIARAERGPIAGSLPAGGRNISLNSSCGRTLGGADLQNARVVADGSLDEYVQISRSRISGIAPPGTPRNTTAQAAQAGASPSPPSSLRRVRRAQAPEARGPRSTWWPRVAGRTPRQAGRHALARSLATRLAAWLVCLAMFTQRD